MNTKEHTHICPAWGAGGLDNSLRKITQNPQKILKPYIREGMTVLDVGCGPGFFSVEMAKMLNGSSGKVIAADIQQKMLDKISKKITGTPYEQRIQLHKSDFDSIARGLIPLSSVDFVLAFWMIHEVSNQRSFLDELASLLKPDGLFFIVEPKFHVPKKAYNAMIDTLKEIGFTVVDTPKVFFSRAVVLKKECPYKYCD